MNILKITGRDAFSTESDEYKKNGLHLGSGVHLKYDEIIYFFGVILVIFSPMAFPCKNSSK